MSDMSNEYILSIFKNTSTASLATCLFKKGLRNQFIQNVRPLNLVDNKMVGPAFTLRYIPAREDRNSIDVFKNPDHPQRKAVEECPPGAVLVIDSRKDARAASAGSILISRLHQRGVHGIVTDGGFRDSEEISKIPIASYHSQPSAPTNLTLHEALESNVPIGCGDVAVFPGDMVVGDQDGVIIVPSHLVNDVAMECKEMELYESFVMEKVSRGFSIIGLYPLVDPNLKDEFENWKRSNRHEE